VDSFEVLSALRIVVAVAVLGYASLLDLRTRKVPNKHWIGLSLIGLVLLVVQLILDDATLEYLLVFVPILAILSDAYMSGENGGVSAKWGPSMKYAIAIASIIALAVLWGGQEYFQHLLAIPVMMLVIVLLYMFDAIRGGADAKALMALSIMFPFYPAIGSLPLIHAESSYAEIAFPFAFVVLVNAAIIVALTPLGFLARNATKGDLQFPQALFGYRMKASEVATRHVWLMERMEQGRHVIYTRPRRDEELGKEIELLTAAGHSTVWVTPKIPFMVPMLIGLLVSIALGNLLFLLFPI